MQTPNSQEGNTSNTELQKILRRLTEADAAIVVANTESTNLQIGALNLNYAIRELGEGELNRIIDAISKKKLEIERKIDDPHLIIGDLFPITFDVSYGQEAQNELVEIKRINSAYKEEERSKKPQEHGLLMKADYPGDKNQSIYILIDPFLPPINTDG